MDQHWNPTSVLYEICAKSGWSIPMFTIVNTTDDGYLVSVNVNGQEFFPRLRGETRRAGRHIASAHFLKCIGFKCEFETSQYSSGTVNDTSGDRSAARGRSASLETRQSKEKGEECPSKSRKHSRSVSWKDEEGGGGNMNEDDSVTPRKEGCCQAVRPSTPYPTEKRKKSLKNKEVVQSPNSRSKIRPQTWDKVDEIPSFVPRKEVSTTKHPRALLPTPPSPRPCRCKFSFPHPSIHPWRYMMNPYRRTMSRVRNDY